MAKQNLCSVDRAGLRQVEEPIVGQRYWVPCVQLKPDFKDPIKRERQRFVPIIGPLHEDREIVKFEHDHWHIDWRFISPFVFERYNRKFPLMRPTPQGAVMLLRYAESADIVRVQRLCRRPMPATVPEPPWLKELEEAYIGTRMKCLTCPHRGMPLDPRNAVDGVVQCQAHGLHWDVKTGEIVRRAE